MIVGVDIGGTKTYIAVFAENGKLLKETRFETAKDYGVFLEDLTTQAAQLETDKAKIACVAVPGLLNRSKGIELSMGNLDWRDRRIQYDTAKALNIQNTLIENDSKLAGLAEARYVSESFQRVLYLTISTGIGGALVIDGQLSKDMLDMEVGKIPLPHEGKLLSWEDFASGRAFFEKYGKKAVEVEDDSTWQEFAAYLNHGLGILYATFQTDVVVFGGGLGQHVSRFKKHLLSYLNENLHPNVHKPQALLATHYRGQSVIYGCYHYAKDKLA